ncbi:tetratricopeptide repeat protein [Marinilabiliaceae bacterium ANBcel2]|nr:tetratricopeptide repeat protein [Marinilabiliaceae bacterium ANBcel2]
MQSSEIKKAEKEVYSLIDEKRIKEAVDILKKLAVHTQNNVLIDGLYNIEMTYKSLLQYTVKGFSDPERQQVYNHLICDLYESADQLFASLYTLYGAGLFYETRRKFKDTPEELFIEKYNIIIEETTNADPSFLSNDLYNSNFTELFELLLSYPLAGKFKDNITKLFSKEGLSWPQQSVLISAITINIMQHFDKKSFQCLLSLIIHPNPQIKQRVVTGALLILYKYDNRLYHCPTIKEGAEILKDKAGEEAIQNIIIQLIRTLETEKLAKQFTDEILPEVARINPNLRDRLDLDNIISDSLKEGKNPDWEDIFSDSPELMDKLEEMSKLQMEGSDLFISTFKMLKHFPFFNKINNWFIPFYYPGATVEEILQNETDAFKNPEILSAMSESGVLCNSDKYSLILSIPHMPQTQKEMMGKMFGSEMKTLKEVENSDNIIDPEKKALSISNQYIQDLYRFFKVHPAKNYFNDPFAWKLDFYNSNFISLIFKSEEFYNKISEYLFSKGRFNEAAEAFNILNSKSEPDMQRTQKLAFCYQQKKEYKKALNLYLKADIIDHTQTWNIKKIALCYRYLNNSEKALEYYLKAEKEAPENIHTLVSIGHCLLEIKDFSKALNYYFKVEYLNPGNKKVWRPIVWCALALGKFDQSEKYCKNLIDSTPSYHDYMNMGHIQWCKGNIEEALTWYKKSITESKNSIDKFYKTFQNDFDILKNHNINQVDVPIMIDKLRYSID